MENQPTASGPALATASRGGSWRPRQVPRWLGSRSARRLMVTLAGVGLAVLLVYLLATPFWHPRTHLFVLAPRDALSIELPATRYTAAQLASWQQLEPVLVGDSRLSLRESSESASRIAQFPLESLVTSRAAFEQAVQRAGQGSIDVVIVSVSAQAIEQNDQALLLVRNRDLQSPPAARLRAQDLIASVRRGAGTKLVVLDLGDVSVDTRAGMLVNRSAELIAKAVEETDDRSLWMLVSHGAWEQSQGSPLLGQTVFGYFVVRGLEGAADANGDRAVDVRELHNYVSANVEAWVAQSSAGAASQTPRLCWGGGDIASASAPLLVPVARSAVATASTRDLHAAVAASKQRGAPSPFASLALSSEAGALGGNTVSRAQSSVARASSALADPVAAAPLPGPLAKVSSFAVKAAETAKNPDDKQGVEKGVEEKPAAGNAASERAALAIAKAWSLRDELASRARFGISPVDFAPHLWRELEADLLAVERLLRSGPPGDAAKLVAHLEREVLPLDVLYDPRLPAVTEPHTLAERIAAALPLASAAPPDDAWPSLGAAEGAARRSHATISEGMQKCIAAFDALVAKTFTQEELAAYIASEPAIACAALREVHLAIELAALPEIDIAVRRELLLVTLQAERVAALPEAASPWLRPQLLEADRWAMTAQRAALDRVHPQWRTDALALLDRASKQYSQIERDASRLSAMQQLRADLTYRAPNYVRMYYALGAAKPPAALDEADVAALLTGLQAWSQTLDRPDPAKWQELNQQAAQVAAAAARIEAFSQSQRLLAEIDGEPQVGQAWRWEVLLNTPLLDAAARVRLLAALPLREADLAERFVAPADGFVVDSAEASVAQESHRTNTPRLILLLTALAAPEKQATPADIRAALAQYQSNLEAGVDAALLAGQALVDPARRRWGLIQLHGALQAARLIDARDAHDLRWPQVGQQLAAAADFDLLELGYERALAARRGARADETAYLESSAQAYRQLAAKLPRQPPLNDPATPPIRVSVPPTGSLMEASRVDLPIEITSQRGYDVPLWLSLDYDPQALAIEVLGATDVVHLPSSKTENTTSSLTLLPAAKQTLRLRVRRVSLPAVPARVVLYVASRESEQRYLIDVDLPTRPRTQLVVKGTPGTWTESASLAQLQPFPNRATAYELELASLSNEALAVEVQLFVPQRAVTDLPPGGVSPAVAKRILGRLEAGKPLGVTPPLTLAVNSVPAPLLFAPPKPEKDDAPPPPVPVDPAAPPAAKPPAKDAPVPVPYGLIAAVTDTQLGRVVLVHLPAWPQKPRRYMQAVASYDEKLQRVVIHVTPQNPSLLPVGGVKVRADFGSALATGAQANTTAVVHGPEYTGVLYGEIPPTQGRVVTVHVDVDDYPRAFTFQVPCFADVANITEQTDRVSLEVRRLPEGSAYRAPAGKIPVELRVDVPPTANLAGADVLEVGIDQRRDRELIGDAPLRLRSDRQAEVLLLPLVGDGLLKLETRVGDLAIDLPAPGLQNAKVSVLAHAVFGDKEAYSPPVEIMLDGAAPRFELPLLTPARSVVAGTELLLSVLMIDEGESGVAKVEMAIDAAGAGKFVDKPPPVPAVLNKEGRWEAKLDTKDLAPGAYTILIRAVDRVGNESAFLPLKGLTIETPLEGNGQLNTITGTALFGTAPVAGFAVTAEGPARFAAKTDAQGKFVIKKVPPGKYKITVSGVVRNKPSVGEVEVGVKAPPAIVPVLEMQVR